MKTKFLASTVMMAALFLIGCTSGPEKAMNKAAEAIEKKDPKAFAEVVQLEMAGAFHQAFRFRGKIKPEKTFTGEPTTNIAAAVIRVASQQDRSWGENMSQLIATGKILVLMGKGHYESYPWNPASLRSASIKEAEGGAIAVVDLPNGLRRWFCLVEKDDSWKIFAVAPDEELATYSVSKEVGSHLNASIAGFKAQEEDKRKKQIAKYKAYDAHLENVAAYKAEVEKEYVRLKSIQQKKLKSLEVRNLKTHVEQNKRGSGVYYDLFIKADIFNGLPHQVKRASFDLVLVKDPNNKEELGSINLAYRDKISPQNTLKKKWHVNLGKTRKDIFDKLKSGEYQIAIVPYKIRTTEESISSHVSRATIEGRLLSERPRAMMMFKPTGYDKWKAEQES